MGLGSEFSPLDLFSHYLRRLDQTPPEDEQEAYLRYMGDWLSARYRADERVQRWKTLPGWVWPLYLTIDAKLIEFCPTAHAPKVEWILCEGSGQYRMMSVRGLLAPFTNAKIRFPWGPMPERGET